MTINDRLTNIFAQDGGMTDDEINATVARLCDEYDLTDAMIDALEGWLSENSYQPDTKEREARLCSIAAGAKRKPIFKVTMDWPHGNAAYYVDVKREEEAIIEGYRKHPAYTREGWKDMGMTHHVEQVYRVPEGEKVITREARAIPFKLY